MALYIASDLPLETIVWKENETYLVISDIGVQEEVVRKHFTKKHVYRIGAHEVCSCGFSAGEYDEFEEDEEDRKANNRNKRSLSELKQFLVNSLQKNNSLELYACWDGEQAHTIESRTSLDPRSIDCNNFRFNQKEFIAVKYLTKLVK